MGKSKKAKTQQTESFSASDVGTDWLQHPSTGNYLTIGGAIVLQFVIILLSLVGPAGSVAPHARQNLVAFLSVLLLAILLSALAVYSKFKRRQKDGSPVPIWSAALLAVSLFILFALLAGRFSI